MTTKKKLFLIHGRNFKPGANKLEKLWVEALRHGIERDFGCKAAGKFGDLSKTFVYYGDLSNAFLSARGSKYAIEADVDARKKTLRTLKKLKEADFNEETYHRNSSLFRSFREFFMDALARPADLFGVADNLASMLAPEMDHYWNEETAFGSDVRAVLTDPLREAFEAGEDIMLIGHSLGTLIAYDVLWKFSYLSEHKSIRSHKLSHFVTLGSPLGNPTVQARLKGGRLKGRRRYPTNISVWANVAAEDDYICHDETLKDDFRSMQTEIQDFRIYNLAVKDGKAHQHHGTGYLVHPDVAKLVKDWMLDSALTDTDGADS